MTEWEFDVGVSTHQLLRAGVVVHHYRTVTVLADDYREASLAAYCLAAADGVQITELLWRL